MFDCIKNHISYFKVFQKDSHSNKFHWNVIFPILFGKMKFLFQKNMVFLFRRKMKDYFPEKWNWDMIFFIWSVKMIFFFPCKYDITFRLKSYLPTKRRSLPFSLVRIRDLMSYILHYYWPFIIDIIFLLIVISAIIIKVY